jgi:sulfatase modifying factor 1
VSPRLERRTQRRLVVGLFVASFVVACADPKQAEDAGSPRDASFDADLGDGSSIDGDLIDGGEPDGDRFDATPMDAGAFDASDPWTGTPCSAGGVPGVCRDVATCEGTSTAGLCPGPSNIRCCTPTTDGGALDAGAWSCDPDARPQPNVGLVEEPGVGGCPAGMVRVASFCIDRFEASLAEVRADGSLVPWSPYFEPASVRVRALSLRGAVPQGYIRGTQAAAACAEAGKRLCTDVEWLRACQGSSETTYPYGDTREPGRCNDARARHPAVEYFGTSADWIWSMLDHPCLNQLPDGLARTGDHAGCESAEGVLDLMGNLHEWTADPAGTFRGGFYVDTVRNGPGCLYRTTAHDVGHRDYSTGFRCCAD